MRRAETESAPQMLAGGGDGDHWIQQRLLRNRIVVVGSDIHEDLANRVCAQLLMLAGESDEDINLFIHSPGGSVAAGLAIYDVMQYIPNDVATLAMGQAASMGQFLLCAGTPGKRAALPHARIMMHQPLAGVSGTASEIAIQAAHINWVKTTMAERIAFHTGQSVEKVASDADRDCWFTAEEAREYGLIDTVIKSSDVMPVMSR
ncbi:ATP-dependent Clp protease proteolytic subunit [Streptomyces hydrogenans]|uniref:ATP-dependent Clp protease proteolytic subunit n=1 Tax=Streptomyces TaxID=1883 RepID=UPI003665A4CC